MLKVQQVHRVTELSISHSALATELHLGTLCAIVGGSGGFKTMLQWFQGFLQNATQTMKGESM